MKKTNPMRPQEDTYSMYEWIVLHDKEINNDTFRESLQKLYGTYELCGSYYEPKGIYYFRKEKTEEEISNNLKKIKKYINEEKEYYNPMTPSEDEYQLYKWDKNKTFDGWSLCGELPVGFYSRKEKTEEEIKSTLKKIEIAKQSKCN